ncbi:hypothetical protein GCM10028808_57780 [Spirosoma migulaei]
MSSCEGALGKLMSVMRSGWERLKNPDTSREADDSPLTAEALRATENELITRTKEVQAIAAAADPTIDEEDQERKVLAKMEELDKEYPHLIPISADSMRTIARHPVPKQIGNYKYVNQWVLPQWPEDRKMPREELVPGVWFQLNRGYLDGIIQYQNPTGQVISVIIRDRGNLGGWARAAHWYYLQRGNVGADDQANYRFVGTFQKYGHTWVNWKMNGSGDDLYISCWKDRWQINVLGSKELEIFEALNPEWLKTIQ